MRKKKEVSLHKLCFAISLCSKPIYPYNIYALFSLHLFFHGDGKTFLQDTDVFIEQYILSEFLLICHPI